MTAERLPAAGVCRECGAPLTRQPRSGASCPVCYERGLREIDAEFLDSYARFGARGRQVVAEACLRALVLADVSDRKLLAGTIYEQFTGAATDFIGLYHALRERRTIPIVQSVLGFTLDSARTVAFFDGLMTAGPIELLSSLGLPHPEQLPARGHGLDARELRQVRDALREALCDLERLQAYREVGERALVSAARGLSGTKALADRTDWLAERRLEPGQVAALALNCDSRRVEVSYLSTDEETLGAVLDGIDVMTRLTRNVIFAFVSLHPPAQFRGAFGAGVSRTQDP